VNSCPLACRVCRAQARHRADPNSRNGYQFGERGGYAGGFGHQGEKA